jgi:hypothetical protein
MTWGYRRLQNFKAFAGLKVGHAKIFNFSSNVYKLSNSIFRDSGDSPGSNYTKYIYILILFSVRSVPFKVHADVPIRYRR